MLGSKMQDEWVSKWQCHFGLRVTVGEEGEQMNKWVGVREMHWGLEECVSERVGQESMWGHWGVGEWESNRLKRVCVRQRECLRRVSRGGLERARGE
jgi:hypothetical protein